MTEPNTRFPGTHLEPTGTTPATPVTYPAVEPSFSNPSGSGSSNTSQAKEQAGQVAGTAKEQAGQVAGTAKEQAGQVKGAATSAASDVASTAKTQAASTVQAAKKQALHVASEAKTQLTDQVSTQHQKATSGLQSLAQGFFDLAEGNVSEGPAKTLAKTAGTRVESIASYVESKEPAELVDDLRMFARRRPGIFLLSAAGTGLILARFVKGTKAAAAGTAAPGSASGTSGAGTSAGYDATESLSTPIGGTNAFPPPTTPGFPPASPPPTRGTYPSSYPAAGAGTDTLGAIPDPYRAPSPSEVSRG